MDWCKWSRSAVSQRLCTLANSPSFEAWHFPKEGTIQTLLLDTTWLPLSVRFVTTDTRGEGNAADGSGSGGSVESWDEFNLKLAWLNWRGGAWWFLNKRVVGLSGYMHRCVCGLWSCVVIISTYLVKRVFPGAATNGYLCTCGWICLIVYFLPIALMTKGEAVQIFSSGKWRNGTSISHCLGC